MLIDPLKGVWIQGRFCIIFAVAGDSGETEAKVIVMPQYPQVWRARGESVQYFKRAVCGHVDGVWGSVLKTCYTWRMAISYVASGLLNTPAHVSPPLFALNRYSNGNTSQSTHVMNIRVQVMELLISPYNKSHVWIEGWLITERKKKKMQEGLRTACPRDAAARWPNLTKGNHSTEIIFYKATP